MNVLRSCVRLFLFILYFIVQHNGMHNFKVKTEPSQSVRVLCRDPVVQCGGWVGVGDDPGVLNKTAMCELLMGRKGLREHGR